MCVVMRAPASYTGEDVVELSCHGSPALLRLVVEVLVASGARLAEPGEFTRRAFLNGRLDLGQAEAVAMLIEARTERAVTLAARALSGALSDRLQRVAGRAPRPRGVTRGRARFSRRGHRRRRRRGGQDRAWARRSGRRSSSRRRGAVASCTTASPRRSSGHRTPANRACSTRCSVARGRSSSPEPGTTRDVVEGVIAVGGVPVRLLDTAGLGTAQDAIDAEGMRRTRMAIDESDLLLVVQDGSVPSDARLLEETAGRARVLVRGKSDLPVHASHLECDAVSVSAVTGEGVDQLVNALREAIGPRGAVDGEENGIAASMRQIELLEALRHALRAGADALTIVPVEAALVELRDALLSLAELRGVAVADPVLDRIFATFCLGK